MAKIKPNILWLQPDHSCELALKDDSWSHQHIHRSADGSTITVKAGNKRYALSSSTESEVEASRRKTSEAQLYKKYSDLYPIGEHFFYIGCIDGSKSYNPESGIVFDLATAYAFFGLDPAATFKKIKEEAGEVVSGWNEAYSKREDFQNRSHCANYFVLSTHTKLVIEPGVGGGIKRRLAGGGPSSSTSGKSVTTELVCVVSNWHFNRTAATKDAIVKCKLTDVNVSLKFASDQWKKIGAARERFHFDRDGVSMSYSTLLSLISDKQFTHNFLPEARKKYEQVEQCDLLVTDPLLDSNEIEDDEEEEEEQPSPTPSTSSHVVLPVKKKKKAASKKQQQQQQQLA